MEKRKINLAELEKRLRRVEHNGTTYWLAEDAYYDNYQDTIAYYAHAYDWIGNEYLMRWNLTEDYAQQLAEMEQAGLYDDLDQSVACDWDSPAEVTLLVENAVEIIPLPYLLTARGQELFGGDVGMEIDIDGLQAAFDDNPSWSIDANGEPIEHTFEASLDVITYDGEVVARRNW
jgi:hypothetical protein